MWEGVLLLRIGKAASHILSSARVQMTFASGCFIATNWKTHWCLDSDLSIEIMWLQCWTCVSVLVETPLTFHWRWFLNTDCTRHDKVWDVILQVTSPLPSPLRAFKDPKRWPVRTCDALCQCSTGSISSISFRMDWLDLLAIQRTLKSLLQHHSSKASVLWCSGFYIVQLSHPYMTTGKIIDLTRWIFADKVMSLLFNMLSRLLITLVPRSKCLLISQLQSWSAVILEPPKIKSDSVSTVSPSISMKWWDWVPCYLRVISGL